MINHNAKRFFGFNFQLLSFCTSNRTRENVICAMLSLHGRERASIRRKNGSRRKEGPHERKTIFLAEAAGGLLPARLYPVAAAAAGGRPADGDLSGNPAAGLKTGVKLCYEGAEDPAEELALELFEPPEEVRVVLEQMTRRGKILPREGGFFLTECAEMTGSEGASAKRMRDLRRRERESDAPGLY